jgi:hypothetical protein
LYHRQLARSHGGFVLTAPQCRFRLSGSRDRAARVRDIRLPRFEGMSAMAD